MGGFFNLNGPFFRIGNMLADIIILSFLWLFFSIPLVTAGAATTALFYVTTRRVSNREGYLIRDFWKSFRLNFKQATACWLIIVLISLVLFINITNISLLGSAGKFVLPIQICFVAEICIISLYVFPLIARFKLSLAEVFKNAVFMANRHALITLGLLLIGAGVMLLSFLTVVFSLVAMGVYAFFASYLIMHVFRKYRPGMDRDP